MKKNSIRLFTLPGLSLLILAFCISCIRESSSAVNTSDARTTLEPLSEPIIVETIATQVITPQAPTVTSIESLITLTPTAPHTPSPIPTLTRLEEGELVQKLMVGNDKCQLPCWWGFQFGVDLGSVRDSFAELGIERWEKTFSDLWDGGDQGRIMVGYFNEVESFYDVNILVDFFSVNDEMQIVDILASRPLRQYGEAELLRDWEKHALSSVLQQYGEPPYVYLNQQTGSGPRVFVLILYYPERGLKFSYQPYSSPDEIEPELCLALDNIRQINLTLYNPQYAEVRAAYLLPPALNPEAEEHYEQWTWEAQTGMDLETFYETYTDSINPGCISITR